MDGETKVCIKCGLERPINLFHRKRRGSEERRARCLPCRREECKRIPTGRAKSWRGLEGVTLEERAQIHANYLVERAKKTAEEDALRDRMQDAWDQESSDWVRVVLGYGTVDVQRSRMFYSMPLPVSMECCDYIDDSFDLMEG